MTRRSGWLLGWVGLALVVGVALWLMPDFAGGPMGAAPAVGRAERVEDARTVLPLPQQSVAEPQALEASSSGATPSTDDTTTPAADDASGLHELTVSGRVVDESGRPVAGARVYLHPSLAGRKLLGLLHRDFFGDVAWEVLPQVLTGADGRFVLAGREAQAFDGTRPANRSDGFSGGTALVVHHTRYRLTGVEVPPRRGRWSVDLGDVVLPPGAALAGRVVDDVGRALVGAMVDMPPLARSAWSDDAWELSHGLLRTSVGENGRFLLEALWPGEFRPRITHPGKAPWRKEVVMLAGETTDLGEVVLLAGAAIRGHVVDEEGEPLAGASLKARPTQMYDVRGEDTVLHESKIAVRSSSFEQHETSTGEDGSFAFDGLVEGRYHVFAALSDREPQGHRDVPTGGEALLFVLAPEALVVLTIVDDATGGPLEGASAIVRRRGSLEDADLDWDLDILTGAEAAARIGRVSGGRGLVVAGPAGFLGTRALAGAPGFAQREVELPGVAPGELLEHTLRLLPASSMAGRVDAVHGAPIADALVRLEEQRESAKHAAKRLEARTDVEGLYRFGDLFAGEWELTVEARGWVAPEPRRLALRDAQQLTGVDLVLLQGATVAGTVFGPDGLPRRNARVVAKKGEGTLRDPRPDRPRPEYERWMKSGADGRFEFEGIPPGEVVFSAHPGAEARLTVVAGSNPDVVLRVRVAPQVHGRVLDPAGRPVDGAEVDLYMDGMRWSLSSAHTDANGEYRLEEELNPGLGLLVARTETAVSPPAHVQLAFDEDPLVDLRFGACAIRGRVVDATTNEPLPDVSVTAERLDAPPSGADLPRRSGEADSDASGRFEIGWLAPGRYRVASQNRTFVMLDALPEVVLSEGVAEVALRLVRGGVLQGAVRTAGAVEGSLEIRLTSLDDGDGEKSAAMPTEGEYRVRGLRAGRHRYEVKRTNRYPPLPDQDHVFASGEVEVALGATVTLDLVLVPMGG